MTCLNLSNPGVQQYVHAYGIRELYRIYVEHDFLLPDFSTYQKARTNQQLSLQSAQAILQTMLDTNQFQFRNLDELTGQIPREATAAFWQNAFYFNKALTYGEVWEEGFHAIFQQIISPEQREELLSAGQQLLRHRLKGLGYKSINQYYDQMLAQYPETYSSLNRDEGLDRLYEEELAKRFVDYLGYEQTPQTYQKQLTQTLTPFLGEKAAKLMSKLFDWLFTKLGLLRNNYMKNRELVDIWMEKVKVGHYALAQVRQPSDTFSVPTTRLIKLGDKNNSALSIGESQQVIRNLGALAMKLKWEPGLGELSESERITLAMEAYSRDYYSQHSNPKYQYLAKQLLPFEIKRGRPTDVPNPEYKLIYQDIEQYLDGMKGLESLEDDLKEDELGRALMDFDKAANEVGFDGFSTWLKQYIGTAGEQVLDSTGTPLSIQVQVNGNVVNLPVIEIADPNRIYYGLARALSNQPDMLSRLKRLVEYGSLDGNKATKAFAQQVLRDISPVQEGSRLSVADTRQLILNSTSFDQLNDQLGPTAKLVLNRVMKGFDLWTRENQEMLLDTRNGLAQLNLSNQNRPEQLQVKIWEAQNKLVDLNQFTEDQLQSTGILGLGIRGQTDTEKLASIYEVAQENRDALNKMGIDLSLSYVQYLTVKEYQKDHPQASLQFILDSDLGSLLRLFDLPQEDIVSSEELDTIGFIFRNKWSLFDENFRAEGTTDKRAQGGANRIIRKLARGNAWFDESVMESTYKNAENKTIYAHQSKTFHLHFFSWFNQENIEQLLTDLYRDGHRTVLRQDESGNLVYLDEDREFYTRNRILQELSEHPELRNHIHAFSIGGIQGVEMVLRKNGPWAKRDGERTDGLTFQGMSSRELGAYLYNSLFTYKSKEPVNPIYLGNLETSSTADLMTVPFVADLLNNTGQLTDKARNLLKEEIRKEYDRIQRVYNREVGFREDGSPYYKIPQEVFEKYNTGSSSILSYDENGVNRQFLVPKNSGSFRALQFSDGIRGLTDERFMTLDGATELTDNQYQYNLVLQAMKGIPFQDQAIQDLLDKSLQKGIQRILDAHWNHLFKTGLLSKTKKGRLHSLLSPEYQRVNKPLGFEDTKGSQDVLKRNVSRKVLSDYLNTLSLNQIIHGDAALVYKNDRADIFKRFKGRNGAITSFATDITIPEWGITQPNRYFRYGILKEMKVKSDILTKGSDGKWTQEEIDVADAQNWITTQGYRMSLHGMGQLDGFHAQLLDAIEAGKPLTPAQEKALVESGIMYNPLKTVAADGQKYLKKSDSILTKQLTSIPVFITEEEFTQLGGSIDTYGRTQVAVGSQTNTGDLSTYRDNGQQVYVRWKARPDMQTLHEMRMRMEGWQREGDNWVYQGQDKQVHLMMPVSASKMLSPNVFNGERYGDMTEHHVNLIDLNYYGLQTQNPSGKTRIVDPTQNLEIILNELNQVKLFVHGKLVDVQDVNKLYQEYLTQRDNNSYQIAWKSVVDKQGKPDLAVIREATYHGAIHSKTDKQTTDLLEPREAYNLNMPMTRDLFIKQYFSHFSKGVLAQKRAGDAKTLMSSHGIKRIKKLVQVGDYISWEVIKQDSEEYYQQVDQPLDDLSSLQYTHHFDRAGKLRENSAWHSQARELLKKSGGKPVYILDSLRHNKPRWENGQVTGYFSESLMPRWYQESQTMEPGLQYMYGVRIPSQDKHSAINIEWVDTLPFYQGSTLVAPKELIQLSGADFDVDKVYMSIPEGFWENGRFVPYGDPEAQATPYEQFLTYIQKYDPTVKTLFRMVRNKPEYRTLIDEYNQQRLAILDRKDRQADLRQLIADLQEQMKQEVGFTDKELNKLRWSLQQIDQLGQYGFVDAAELDLSRLSFSPTLLTHKAISEAFKTLQPLIDQRASARADMKTLWGEIRQLQQQRAEIDRAIRQEVLETLRLPLTEKQFEDKEKTLRPTGNSQNNGILNNNLLAIMQQALANRQTLDYDDRQGNQANTPATMDPLKKRKGLTYTRQVGEKPVTVRLFESADDVVPSHFPLTHLQVHEKNGIGKSLIGVAVNFNLTMINAVKLGFRVQESYLPKLTGLSNQRKGYFQVESPDGDGFVRTFDINSAIISANTDEAKEQLNAFYNMNPDAQSAVLLMVAMGYPLESALLYINQPAIRRYLDLQAIKDYTLKLPSEQDYQYMSKERLAKQAVNWDGDWESPEVAYTQDQLKQAIWSQKSGHPLDDPKQAAAIQRQILFDFLNLQQVGQELAQFTRFIKMKKGLSPELESFLKLEESRLNLGFDNDKYDPTARAIDIRGMLEANPALSSQYLNYINRIVPGQNYLQTELFLRKQETFTDLVKEIRAQLKPSLNELETEQVNQAAETLLFTRLYQEWLRENRPQDELNTSQLYQYPDTQTIASRFQDFRQQYAYYRINEQNQVEKGPFADNALFGKIMKENRDGLELLSLNTMVKLRPEQQEALIDGFLELATRTVDGELVGQQLSRELFYYFLLKDGLQFRNNSLGKVFAAPAFRSLSDSLDRYMSGSQQVSMNPNWASQLSGDVNFSSMSYRINQPFDSKLQAINNQFKLFQITWIPGATEEDNQPIALTIDLTNTDNPNVISYFQAARILTNPVDQEEASILNHRFVTYRGQLYERLKMGNPDQIQYVRTVASGSTQVNGATGLFREFTDSARRDIQQLLEKARLVNQPTLVDYYDQLLGTEPTPVETPPQKEEVVSQVDSPVIVATPVPEKNTERATLVKPVSSNQEFQPNPEQQQAIDKAIEFIQNGNSADYFLIEGKAGTGKSTVIRQVLKEFKGDRIVVSALSHKAKQVISDSIDKEKIPAEKVTVAGLLGMKLDDETGQFIKPNPFDEEFTSSPPIELADIIVVDEASMINEEALQLIMTDKRPSAKVIFLGDIGQLPPIRPEGSANQNKPSPVFATVNKAILVTRVRQGEENPILPFADYYWENSQSDTPVINPAPVSARQTIISPEGSLRFVSSMDSILDETIDLFSQAVESQNPNRVKIVVYRNNIRQSLNKTIHDALFGSSTEFAPGELLIFLNKFGKNFQNSDEVQVLSAQDRLLSIDNQEYRVWELQLPTQDERGRAIVETVPVIASSDQARYRQYVSSLFQQARSMPKGPVRTEAMKKAWAASNRFASLDYAYAITSHKSQGSTYDEVIVHEQDILSVGPTSPAAKSQSIYTALTRARHQATVISALPVSFPPQSADDTQFGPCTKP